MNNKQKSLLKCCGAYLSIILAFSIVYLCSYLCNPKLFAFSSDMKATQTEQKRTETTEKINQLQKELDSAKQQREAMQAVKDHFDKSESPPLLNVQENYSTFTIDIGAYICTVSAGTKPGGGRGGPGPKDYATMELRLKSDPDSTGAKYSFDMLELHAIVSPNPIKLKSDIHVYREQAKAILDNLISKESDVQKDLSVQIGYLKTLSLPEAIIWSWWDFLYFSTITQATVGYGDILPNSRFIRGLVVIQILIGFLITVYFVNVSLIQDDRLTGPDSPGSSAAG